MTNTADVNSRFQPFGQHSHLTSSFTSLSQTLPSTTTTTTNIDDFNNSIVDGNSISSKLNALGLGGGGGGGGGNTNNTLTGNDNVTTTTTTNSTSGFDNSSTSGSGIWGPK